MEIVAVHTDPKDSEEWGDITYVKLSTGEVCYFEDVAIAIALGINYFTNPGRVPVGIVTIDGVSRLRSNPDGVAKNNLRSLKRFD